MNWIEELEQRADELLPDYVAAYVRGSAGDGTCLREGLASWARMRLRPSVLHDRTAATAKLTVLGTPLRTPLMVAPMAQQVAAHSKGEAATARAAAAVGSLLAVSSNTGVRFADINATGVPWWYQVYVMRKRSMTHRLVERAAAAGARALVLTVDTTALTKELPGIQPTAWPDNALRVRLTNLNKWERALGRRGGGLLSAADLTPDVIGWLRDLSGLPVVVKGILTARDARRCVDAGAAAVVVSTHGGRRLGVSIGSAHALPEVAAEVGREVEVYVDSGLRAGYHVVAALALGARAVFIGRPVMWGLATDGEAGARSVLERLHKEVVATMRQMGVAHLADLDAGHVLTGYGCDCRGHGH